MSDALIFGAAAWLLLKGDGSSSSSSSSSSSDDRPTPVDPPAPAPDQGDGNQPSEESEDIWVAQGAPNKCGFAVFKYGVRFMGHGWEYTYLVVDQKNGTLCVVDPPSPYPTYQTLDGLDFSAFKTASDAKNYADQKCKAQQLEDQRLVEPELEESVAKDNNRFRIIRTELNSQPQFEIESFSLGDIYSGREY